MHTRLDVLSCAYTLRGQAISTPSSASSPPCFLLDPHPTGLHLNRELDGQSSWLHGIRGESRVVCIRNGLLQVLAHAKPASLSSEHMVAHPGNILISSIQLGLRQENDV